MEILFHGTGHYPTGEIIGPARWPHWDLLVVLRGAAAMEAGVRGFRRKMVLDEGDALLIPAGTQFRGIGQTRQTTIWVVHFQNPPFSAVQPLRHFRRSAGDAFARGLLTEISGTYQRSQRSMNEPYLASLVVALLEKLRSTTSLAKPQADTRLRMWRVEDIEALGSGPFPFAEALAAHAGLSQSHHRTLFKQQFGITPGRHLHQLRLVYARKLLRETRLPIKQIATSCGYGEAVAFHRAFLAGCGISPSGFRRSHPPAA